MELWFTDLSRFLSVNCLTFTEFISLANAIQNWKFKEHYNTCMSIFSSLKFTIQPLGWWLNFLSVLLVIVHGQSVLQTTIVVIFDTGCSIM